MTKNTATVIKSTADSLGSTKPERRKAPLWVLALRLVGWSTLVIVASLVIVEALFAAAHIGEEEFVSAEPTIGFWHFPNKQITWRSEGYSQSTSSGDGLRDVDFSLNKPAGVKRIAFTGDSMVEGYQVAPEQTFVKLVADRLRHDGIQAEGMNFGMSGFSTVQELYLFKEKILKYHPDVLVLAYHIGDNEKNEYTKPDGGGFMPRPYARLTKEGFLQTDWRGYDSWWNGAMRDQHESTRWLRANSRLWGVMTKLQLQLSDQKWYANLIKALDRNRVVAQDIPESAGRFTSTDADFGLPPTKLDTSFATLPEFHSVSFPDQPGLNERTRKEIWKNKEASYGWRAIVRNSNNRFAMTGAVIDTLNRACAKNGCKLVVAGLPAPSNSLLYKRELHMMGKLADRSGFLFIDLNADFPKIAPMEKTDFYFNVHYTPKGHQLVTDLLLKRMRQAGLVDHLRTGS